MSVPSEILIAFVTKLTLYGFRPPEARFPKFLRILENAGATRLAQSPSALPRIGIGLA
jgi:hypothetical protein